jgi:hypothetical protein
LEFPQETKVHDERECAKGYRDCQNGYTGEAEVHEDYQ